MTHMQELIVEVRDKNLVRLGQIAPKDLDLVIEDQYNDVGSWTLKLDAEHPMAPYLRQPGSGIVVTAHNGEVVFSGLTDQPEMAATVTEPGGILTVNGLSDTVLLGDRVCYPDPSDPDPVTSNQTASHDVRTGAAETLMHEYVAANLGPSAPVGRRDSRVLMAAHGSRGSVVTKRARFPKLGTLLKELAVSDVRLGFRLIQRGSNIMFETYEVTDRSAQIRFDIKNNMLSGHRVTTAPPDITDAIVAGQGDLSERTMVHVTSAESVAAGTAWGRRIEKFIDQRNTDDLSELTRAGIEALDEGGFSQLSVHIVPMDDMSLDYGHDWTLGDVVSVVVEGVELSAIVTGYVLTHNADGFRMGAILGSLGDASADRLGGLENRVSNLERNSGSGNGSGAVSLWDGAGYANGKSTHYIGPMDPALYEVVADGAIWDEVNF